jgi:hypothetical protein
MQPAEAPGKCWLIYIAPCRATAYSLARSQNLATASGNTRIAPLRMGNCFGLFSLCTKPLADDGPGGPPGEPQKLEVSPVEDEDDVKKPTPTPTPTPPASESNVLLRVSSQPLSDASGAAPALTTSRS